MWCWCKHHTLVALISLCFFNLMHTSCADYSLEVDILNSLPIDFSSFDQKPVLVICLEIAFMFINDIILKSFFVKSFLNWDSFLRNHLTFVKFSKLLIFINLVNLVFNNLWDSNWIWVCWKYLLIRL